MVFTKVAILLSFLVFNAPAQNIDIGSLGGLAGCELNCVNSAKDADNGCQPNDSQCLCSSTAFVDSIHECSVKNCLGGNTQANIQVAGSFCADSVAANNNSPQPIEASSTTPDPSQTIAQDISLAAVTQISDGQVQTSVDPTHTDPTTSPLSAVESTADSHGTSSIEFTVPTRTRKKTSSTATSTKTTGQASTTFASSAAPTSPAPVASSTASPSNPATGLTKGAKIGIGLGVPLGVLLMAGTLAWFFLRRRKQSGRQSMARLHNNQPVAEAPSIIGINDAPPARRTAKKPSSNVIFAEGPLSP